VNEVNASACVGESLPGVDPRRCRPADEDMRQQQAGRTSMQQAQETKPQPREQRSPGDWVKLIRKLRWIGLEDEARALQLAVSTLPAEQRGSVSAGPFSTD
jgi:hypothetical protein